MLQQAKCEHDTAKLAMPSYGVPGAKIRYKNDIKRITRPLDSHLMNFLEKTAINIAHKNAATTVSKPATQVDMPGCACDIA